MPSRIDDVSPVLFYYHWIEFHHQFGGHKNGHRLICLFEIYGYLINPQSERDSENNYRCIFEIAYNLPGITHEFDSSIGKAFRGEAVVCYRKPLIT